MKAVCKTLNAPSVLTLNKGCKKSLTLYGSQNPMFYYITATLSMQKKSCNLQLYTAMSVMQKSNDILFSSSAFKHVEMHLCQARKCTSVQHNHDLNLSVLQEIGNV